MKPVTRIMRPYDGSAPGIPKAKRPARQRKPDALDQMLAVTRRRPAPASQLPQIILPWPPTELWPNRQKGRHWTHSYRAKRAMVKAAANACIVVGYHHITVAPGTIRVRWIACPPARHRWDDDGLTGALKAARDTIARALGVDDSRFDASVERGDPCRDGAVIVRMEVI
ncbi:hypothetical protein LOS78_01755 [Paracoccus sp. MA]|uniref:hypothetical protein n=1 Tax=Paracoccus sp. MA TaxID=2895796 RepID=UPI001E40142F|nr:hypothetical protein [Paracoccus sp. MA]UFM64224.1 hypothetical protein LOS78_01755 [Paracoccus sp. MA]